MRIAIACSSFFLDRTYQENIWAEQLVKLGHTVRVISSGPSNTSPELFQSPVGAYEVQRVRTQVLPRSIYISNQTGRAVREFNPDLAIIYGDKRFTLSLLREPALAKTPIISTYSENLGMHEYDWRKPGISIKQRAKALGFSLIRGGPIRDNGRRSDLIVGNTPQTRGIILRQFPDANERIAIDQKIIDCPLGFSPDHYRHDPSIREAVRTELGLKPDDVVVCTSSRFDPEKRTSIQLVIDACRRVIPGIACLRAIIVGFSDSPTSKEIAANIRTGDFADRFMIQPFADRVRMNALFNASDIVVYNLATISCQEALGTGLYACFAENGTMNHLLSSENQGRLYGANDPESLAGCIEEEARRMQSLSSAERVAERHVRAQANQWLGYDKIIQTVLEALSGRGHRRVH